MAKLRLLLENTFDDSTVTLSQGTAEPTLPVTNLKRQSRSKVFRTTNSANTEIFATFPVPVTISSLIIGRHNLSAGNQYRLRLFSDTAATNEIHNTGLLEVLPSQEGSDLWLWGAFPWGSVPWGSDRSFNEFSSAATLPIWLDAEYTIRSFKLELINQETINANSSTINANSSTINANTTSLSGTLTYYEIGRLMSGVYIEPTYNLSFGHSMSWEEGTTQYRTDAGTLRSDIGLPTKKFEFDLNTISESDRSLLQNEFRKVGLRRDFYVSLFPEIDEIQKQIDYSGIVKLTKVPKFTEFVNNYYRSKYVMEEV